MANLRIVTANLIEASTLAAAPPLETALPEGNLLDVRRAFVARTTSAAAQEFSGDFATNTTLNCCVLWAHNLTDNATWRLRIYSAAAQGGAVLYDSTAVAPHTAGLFDAWPARRRFAALYFAGSSITTARSWQIDIADAGNPDGFLQAGELWLGVYTELGFNFEHEPALSTGDNSRYQRTRGGGGFRSGAAVVPWREAGISFADLTNDEAEMLDSIQRANGRFWVDMYPDNAYAPKERNGRMIGQFEQKYATVPLLTQFNKKRVKVVED